MAARRIPHRPIRVRRSVMDRANLVTTIQGRVPSALTSTLTASAATMTTAGSITLTFTARDVDSNLIAGYTPVPESGVV